MPVKSCVKGFSAPEATGAQQLSAHASYSSDLHAETKTASTSSSSLAVALEGPNVAVFAGIGNAYPFGPPGFHGSSTVRYVSCGSGIRSS